VQLSGSTLRSRDDTFKAELLRELGQEVLPLFTEKRLNPQIARTFPIGEAEEAFAELATNQITGKVVLVVDPALV